MQPAQVYISNCLFKATLRLLVRIGAMITPVFRSNEADSLEELTAQLGRLVSSH
jgi:hypothetical protein